MPPHTHKLKLSEVHKNKQQQRHTQKLHTAHVLIRQGGPELRGIAASRRPQPMTHETHDHK